MAFGSSDVILLPSRVVRPEDFRLDPHIPSEGVVTYDFRGVRDYEPHALDGLVRITRKRVVRLLIDPGSPLFFQVQGRFPAAELFPVSADDHRSTATEWFVGSKALQAHPGLSRAHRSAPAAPSAREGAVKPILLGTDTPVTVSLGTIAKWLAVAFGLCAGLFGFRESMRQDIKSWFNETAPAVYVRRDEFNQFSQQVTGDLREIKGSQGEKDRRMDRLETIIERIAGQMGVQVPPRRVPAIAPASATARPASALAAPLRGPGQSWPAPTASRKDLH